MTGVLSGSTRLPAWGSIYGVPGIISLSLRLAAHHGPLWIHLSRPSPRRIAAVDKLRKGGLASFARDAGICGRADHGSCGQRHFTSPHEGGGGGGQ